MRGSWVPRLALVVIAVTACGSLGAEPIGTFPSPVTVEDARIGAPAGSTAALYFTATSAGPADRLIGASSQVAASVELHESVIGSDGTATMGPVAAMGLPAGGSLILEPGGLHLMLTNVESLQVGDVVAVTLIWEKAGEMAIQAQVVDPADTMSGHDHG